MKVSQVDITVTAHATEDEQKVLQALNILIPEELRSKIKFSKLVLKGYYGNPITRISTSVRGEDAEKVACRIFQMLDDLDRKALESSFNLRFEGGRLYLRFDKQQAYLGRLRLLEGDDVVRVVIQFTGKGSTEAKAVIEYLKVRGLI